MDELDNIELQRIVNLKNNLQDGVFPLAGRDSSFAVVAVRCNSDSSVGKKKLEKDRIYYLLKGYSVESAMKDCGLRDDIDVLYDDYLDANNIYTPHVIMSAVVGQNGSGKSSLIEFMIRLINNLAAATFGEIKTNPSSERLHYIEHVNGDLWFEKNGSIFKLSVNNDLVELFNISNTDEKGTPEKIYSSKETSNRDGDIFLRISDNALRDIYNNFFYTIISNYSIHAYNTRDFNNENDSESKISWIKEHTSPKENPDKDSKYEINNWLDGVFHKNDGYQIPIVLTPYRHNGDIKINTENDLAKERLISLAITNNNFRTINGHLKLESLSIRDVKRNYGYEAIKSRLGLGNLSPEGYRNLKDQIKEWWGNLLGRSLQYYSYKPFFDQAIDYLVYKTIKVASKYRQHIAPFLKLKTIQNGYDHDLVNDILASESEDHSHISRKIFQTLAYILGDVYSGSIREGSVSEISIQEIEELYRKGFASLLDQHKNNISAVISEVAIQSAIPPPFLDIRINLCEEKNESVKISFESLSSGERQIAYAVSSILYHLDNLNSVKSDESDSLRIPYENVFIILEEVELYFHPELQQGLIKNILDGIKQMALDHIKGVHILFVTHSPYVLSDIPKQNVLALESNGMPSERVLNTFCANIHEMLEDSFFLSNGSQGYFAQWEVGHLMACIKIHQIHYQNNKAAIINLKSNKRNDNEYVEVFEKLATRYPESPFKTSSGKLNYARFCDEFSINQIKNRISLIDEPVVREVLRHELNMVMECDTNLRELRMKELEQELKRLKEM